MTAAGPYNEVLRTSRLRESVRVYSVEGSKLQFRVFAEAGELVPDPSGAFETIVRESREGVPLDGVCARLQDSGVPGEAVRQCVDVLLHLNLLESADPLPARHDRQIRYFESGRMNALPGSYYQEALAHSRVAVVGADASGSCLAQTLITAGAGELWIIDGDPVTEATTAHQHVYERAMTGWGRTGVCDEAGGGLNPEVKVRTARSLAEVTEPAELSLCLIGAGASISVTEAADWCAAHQVPHWMYGVVAGEAVLDPVYIPGRTPCPRCAASPFLTGASSAVENGLLAAAIAHVTALQAISFLSGFSRPVNLGSRVILGAAEYEFRIEEISLRTGLCPDCSRRAAEIREAASVLCHGPAPAGEATPLAAAVLDQSRLDFYPLIESVQGDEIITGREATGTFVSLGMLESQFLHLLQQALPVQRAREMFARYHAIPELKVTTFVGTLLESGFAARIDGFTPAGEPQQKRFHLTWLEAKRVAFLFSRPALALYAVLTALAAAAIIANPAYRPSYRDAIFLPSISLSLIINAAFGWLTAVPHELFHLFAAKRAGCEASIGIGHRLYYVVLETDVTGIWKAPARKRYMVYMAGLIWDVLCCDAFVAGLWLADQGVLHMHEYVYLFLKAALALTLFKVVWQFLFYMRTDIYYVVATWLRCKNLHSDTINYLRNHLASELPWVRAVDMGQVPAAEMRFVRVYALLMLAGTLLSIGVFSAALLPLGALMQDGVVSGFGQGLTGHAATFADSVVASAFIVLNLALLFYTIIAKSRKRRLVAR